MIEISFHPETTTPKTLGPDGAQWSKEELHYYAFPGVFKFRVEGLDLGQPREPLFDVAVSILASLGALIDGTPTLFEWTEGGEGLIFIREADRVRMAREYEPELSVTVPLAELKNAFRAAASHLFERILALRPELRLNPDFVLAMDKISLPPT